MHVFFERPLWNICQTGVLSVLGADVSEITILRLIMCVLYVGRDRAQQVGFFQYGAGSGGVLKKKSWADGGFWTG